jgi:hypothetical protein
MKRPREYAIHAQLLITPPAKLKRLEAYVALQGA